MRVLIVDDEPIALDRLETALACFPEAQLVGRAMTGRQALALVREQQPDVVLLDISMPGQDGLTIMSALRETSDPPEVIFVTALDQHAVRAFELHAADYLLKPVAFERLREALRRAQDRLRARSAERRFAELDQVIGALKGERSGKYDHELWVRTRLGMDRVPVSEVITFKAEGDYVSVNTRDKSHLIKEALASLSERLDPALFLRIHRSTVVNIARVKGVRRRQPRGIALAMDNGATLEVGPSYTDAVMAALNTRRWR